MYACNIMSKNRTIYMIPYLRKNKMAAYIYTGILKVITFEEWAGESGNVHFNTHMQ